jgi:metal-responsive CopG/Arc/MetJ family transcriptional regulator
MKRRTSVRTWVTLPADLLRLVDRIAGGTNRSRVIEDALRDFVERRARRERDTRDLETINRNAERLNDEAVDVLDYQART